VDIVKVLKTQDKNYIRTMRTAGLKVGTDRRQNCLPCLTITPQKIDKIKAQLTALVDLIKPLSFNTGSADDSAVKDDLDEDELEILRDAGIISCSRLMGNGRKPKHVVFVDDKEEGAHHILRLSIEDLINLVSARQYASRRKSSASHTDVNMDISEFIPDLGWKVPDGKKRKSNFTSETTTGGDQEADEERRQLAVVCLSSLHSHH
jgi:hypothetical protein